ncbi:MAG: endonuclease, partial [Bacteroidales bacterium]|nr:endonuclease [Bacteroidales bacterium]
MENLFNPQDDSLKNDDAFTPQGLYHWTYKKYVRKVNNIAKVLLAMGTWEPPDIIGLAEIEDDAVLRKLCYDSPLKG